MKFFESLKHKIEKDASKVILKHMLKMREKKQL